MASWAFHAEERPQGASRSTHNRNAPDAFRMLFRVGMKWGRHMQKAIGFVWTIGFFGLLAPANAQTQPPSTPVTAFDGTYAFVSATKLNETYMTTWTNRMGRCGDVRKLGPLTIANGQARYSGSGRVTRAGFEGTVGPQGELALRLAAPASKSSLGAEIVTHGTIDGTGTIRARQTSRGCSYDLVWQKETR